MIDELASVDPKAKLAKDVTVGPYTIIDAEVEIGAGTKIESHVVIKGRTTIGKNNKIYQFSSIGEAPQHLGYKGEDTALEIGDNNIIREFCSIHRGSTTEGHGITKIGNNNFLMNYVHVAHDCILHNNIILANNVTLAGHVTVDNAAVFGGSVVIAQFCKIGAYSFIVGTTPINKDILPYTLVSIHRGKNKPNTCGLNLVGLRRSGFSRDVIKILKQAYNIIFEQGLTKDQVIPKLKTMAENCPEVQLLIDAMEQSTRGIIR